MTSTFAPEMRDRRVLVTGAGSGIGLATAQVLHRQGARVAAVVQHASQSAAVQAQVPDAMVLVQDLLDDALCSALPARAAQALGGLDGLACCAGIFIKKGSDETTMQEWRRTLELNLNSTFVLVRAAIAHMRGAQVRDASVVVVTSQIGLVGYAHGAAYAASKAGLNAMVKSLALEWAEQGVRVNAVGPGPVQTAMIEATMADPASRAAMIQNVPMGRGGNAGRDWRAGQLSAPSTGLLSSPARWCAPTAASPHGDRQGLVEPAVAPQRSCQRPFQSLAAIHSSSDSAEQVAPSIARTQRQASAKVHDRTGAPSRAGICRMDFKLGMPVPSITIASSDFPRSVGSACMTDSEPSA